MSKISFQCYACSQTLLVRADKGGQKAKCPRCSTPLTIPVAAVETEVAAAAAQVPTVVQNVQAAAPPPVVSAVEEPPLVTQAVDDEPVVTSAVDDEDDYDLGRRAAPRKKVKARSGKNWLMTHIGLWVLFGGLCLVCFVIFLDQIGMLLLMIEQMPSSSPRSGQPSQAYVTVLKIAGIMFLVAVIPGYLGQILTLFGPRDSAAVTAAIATLAVGALGWLVYLLFHVLHVFGTNVISLEFSGQMRDMESMRSEMDSLRIKVLTWYTLLPTFFVVLPFALGAAHTAAIGRQVGSRWTKVLTGAVAALVVFFLGVAVINVVLMFVKVDSEAAAKGWFWIRWIAHWLLTILEFAGLMAWAVGAFLVRSAARK